MREAFGGSWLLGFVVLFIVLFSAYLAVSVNYTKAFKAKNKIINIIEQNEGFSTASNLCKNNKSDACLKNSKSTEDKIYAYLKESGFIINDLNGKVCPDDDYKFIQDGGYCVQRVCTSQGSYYKVNTFIKIELPIVWQTFTVPIKGETKVLYYTNDGIECSNKIK